jgi:hypothetical protein
MGQRSLRHHRVRERLGHRVDPATVILDEGVAAAVPGHGRRARRKIRAQSNQVRIGRVGIHIGYERGTIVLSAASAIFCNAAFSDDQDEPVSLLHLEGY